MARFLTPRRICVLSVIALYLDGHAAESSRLSILSFIASHVHLPTGHEQHDFEQVIVNLAESLVSLFKPLQDLQSGVPGRSIYDLFLGSLYEIDGIDSLHEFFETVHGRLSLQPSVAGSPALPALSPGSPLGQYVRRSHVEFTRMQFADLQALWKAFASYRVPTWDNWAQRNPEKANKLVQEMSELQIAALSHKEDSISLPANISAEDTDSLLTMSITRLQKLGTRMPSTLKSALQQWIANLSNDSGVQSLQHFLTFFEHWRSGQYVMALESLHRYFDYSLVAKGTNAENNMRVYYQYALLHLSVLHADFECWDESVEAMEECIATARENQDTACLNFALSWLLYLRQATPRGNTSSFHDVSGLTGNGSGEQDEIAFLKAKAKETKHWSLLSTTLLEEAKLEMHRSGSTNRSMEHIIQSSFLNVQHNLRTLIPATCLFEAGFYSRLGQAHLATRITQTVQHLDSGDCPRSDTVRAICRVAFQLAQEGRYEDSIQLLQSASSWAKGVLRLEQRMTGYIDLVQLMRSLHQDDLRAATHYLIQLQPLRDSNEPEMDSELNLREIDLFIRSQELDKALETVNAHLQRLKSTPSADIAQRLQFLVLKARIFAAGGKPAKGFSIVLRAASMAEKYRLVPIMLEAVAALAIILNDISEFEAAKDMVEAILPAAVENRRGCLTAELHATLTESYVGIAGHRCEVDSAERIRNMQKAETHAERSALECIKLKDLNGTLDAISMRARLARWQRDETSAARLDDMWETFFRTRQSNKVT